MFKVRFYSSSDEQTFLEFLHRDATLSNFLGAMRAPKIKILGAHKKIYEPTMNLSWKVQKLKLRYIAFYLVVTTYTLNN